MTNKLQQTSSVKSPNEALTDASIALHDEISIERPLEQVWTRLLDYPIWFLTSDRFERISGNWGQVGETLKVDGGMRNELIRIRPMQGATWKFCRTLGCDKDLIFYDLEIAEIGAATRLSVRYFSQGGWSEVMANEMIKEQSQGKTPTFIRQLCLAFKAYAEDGITLKDFQAMQVVE